MALEPKTATTGTDDEKNTELHDMTRRFWIGAALTLPVFVLAMAPAESRLCVSLQRAGHPGGSGRALPVLRLAAQPDHCRRCDEPEFRLGHQQCPAPA